MLSIYFDFYRLQAMRVGFGRLRADLFALQALILDGYDVSDIVASWTSEA